MSLIARVAYAILAGIAAFIVMIVLAAVVELLGASAAEVADVLRRFAPIVAILVGVYYFFAGYRLFPHKP